jgi:hypothetical protein
MTKTPEDRQPVGEQADQQQDKPETNCSHYSLRFQLEKICPHCQIEKLEYNSMLQLTCPRCGILENGAFT